MASILPVLRDQFDQLIKKSYVRAKEVGHADDADQPAVSDDHQGGFW
jgi:hypothetical protein